MRNVDERTDPISKETRCRLWCSIFMLEQFLTTITGRPTSLDRTFAVNAPLPFSEDQFTDTPMSRFLTNYSEREKIVNWTLFENSLQTSARSEQLKSVQPSPPLYFFYQVDLSLIANAITSNLYGIHAPQYGKKPLERAIKSYSQKLDSWVSTIDDELSFVDRNGEPLQSVLSRSQIGLALSFYSTSILLNRPCLSRPGLQERSGIRFPRNQFGNDTALACVRSATLLLGVLPDEASGDWFYRTSPWWTMLHYLMQATTVLLIHLAVGPVPARTERGVEKYGEAALPDTALLGCKKALRWLHLMSEKDIACRRGFGLCHGLFCRIASSKDLSLEGVPFPSSLRSSDHPDPAIPSSLSTAAAGSFGGLNHGGIGSGVPTTATAFDFDTGNRPNDPFPLSLTEESEVAWFLSMADFDQVPTVDNTG